MVHSSKIKHKEKEMVQLYEKETGERWRVDVMTGVKGEPEVRLNFITVPQ